MALLAAAVVTMSAITAGPPFILRIESTASTNMCLWQVEAYNAAGTNILRNCSMDRPHLSLEEQRAQQCVTDGVGYNSHMIPTMISDPDYITGGQWGKLTWLTDGVVYSTKKNHEFDAQTGVTPTRGPMVGAFLEFDLSKVNTTTKNRPVSATIFTMAGSGDNGWKTVSLLDSARRVVSLHNFVSYQKSSMCSLFKKLIYYPKFQYIYKCTVPLVPYKGAAVSIPRRTFNWQPLHQVLPATNAPVVPDRQQRLARFAARDTPTAVQKLAEDLFGGGGQVIRAPDTEAAFVAFGKGDFIGALNAFKAAFFKQLVPRNIHYAYSMSLTQCCEYSRAADDLFANYTVTFAASTVSGDISIVEVSLAKIEVGAINWLHLGKDLVSVQKWTGVSAQWNSLLTAFNASKDTKYVLHWAALIDDWTMNFFEDVDAASHSGVNAKDIFVMIGANYMGELLELMGDIEVHSHLSAALPSTTFARLMLKLNAEYLPAYFRVARGTMFNHDTSGMAANYIVARYIQQFFSGRLLMREIRDHFQRWMAWGETAYGSMIEIGDEGHFAMPLDNLGVLLDQFDQDQPVWWTPELRVWGRDVFRQMSQYYFRHASPLGAFHRFGHAMPNSHRLFDFGNASRMNPICDLGCGVLNHTRKVVVEGTYDGCVLDIINAVYGRGSGPFPSINNTPPQRLLVMDALWTQANSVLDAHPNHSFDPSTLISYRTDVMPFAGLYYVRSGWSKGHLFMHCIAPPGIGSTDFGGSLNPDPEGMGAAWFAVPGACELHISGADLWKQSILFPLAKVPALRVNGDSPLPTYLTRGLHPGSKETAMAFASQQPVTGRFFSGAHFDVVEPEYRGAFATASSSFTTTTYQGLKGSQERVAFPAKHTLGNWSRLLLHAVPFRAIFVVDTYSFARSSTPLTLDTTLTLRLAVPKGATTIDSERVTINQARGFVSSNNTHQNQTSLSVYFGSTDSLTLTTQTPSKPSSAFATLFPNASLSQIIDVEVTVSRSATSATPTPLLSLMFATGVGVTSGIANATVLPKGRGIDAVATDGSRLCLRSSSDTTPPTTSCFGLEGLPCATLLAWCTETSAIAGPRVRTDSCAGRIEGLALDCHGNSTSAIPADFAFNFTSPGVFDRTPIGRPLRKPTFEGPAPFLASTPLISGPTEVVITSPDAAAGDADIRYTLDGSRPTRDSALYVPGKPLTVTDTTLVKAVAFRKPEASTGKYPGGVPRNAFASDGTQFSAVGYAQFELVSPSPAALTGNTAVPGGAGSVQPGLCARTRQDTSWARLWATTGSTFGFGGKDLAHLVANVDSTTLAALIQETGFCNTSSASSSQIQFPGFQLRGLFNATHTGVYTFHAPKELQMPHAASRAAGYDLRLALDGKEVALTQRPHGLGGWHVALTMGLHDFAFDYADGRCANPRTGELAPGSFYGLWQDYPQPWVTNTRRVPSQLTYTWPGRTGETVFTPDLFVHKTGAC